MIKKIIRSLAMAIVIVFILALIIRHGEKTDPGLFLCKDCNLILITMTNLRYDHISSNGYLRQTTPYLDALINESIVFDNAFGHASWTLPESISLYTGLYPFEHGVMNRYDGSKLSNLIPTLVDVLNKNGYKTAAFTGGFDYNTDFGLTSRFSVYEECAKAENNNYPRQPGPKGTPGPSAYGELTCTVPKALSFLEKNYKKKFFLHVQGFDAHCPFSQNGGYLYDRSYKGNIDFSGCLWTFDKTKPIDINRESFYSVFSSNTGTSSAVLLGKEDISHLIAIYDEAINSADYQISKLLSRVKQLGIWDKTIIVFTSEHGDVFGKHGRFMRGGPLKGTFYDDVIHVPLIIKNPKISPKRIQGLVEHIDVAPTLINFLGLKHLHNISGKSLIPLIFKNREVNSYIRAGSQYSPNPDNAYYFKKTNVNVVRNKNWKLIQETVLDDSSPLQNTELYAIVNDKEELTNLANKRQDVVSDLKRKLFPWNNKK